MNLNIDNLHLFLLSTNVLTLMIAALYNMAIITRYDSKIEKLMDRLMSRSLSEYKRAQAPVHTKKVLPPSRGYTDAEMAVWEENNRGAQEKGVDAINEEIEESLSKVRQADQRAGVL